FGHLKPLIAAVIGHEPGGGRPIAVGYYGGRCAAVAGPDGHGAVAARAKPPGGGLDRGAPGRSGPGLAAPALCRPTLFQPGTAGGGGGGAVVDRSRSHGAV